MHIYVHMHTYVKHIYIYIYTYTHTHIHTRDHSINRHCFFLLKHSTYIYIYIFWHSAWHSIWHSCETSLMSSSRFGTTTETPWNGAKSVLYLCSRLWFLDFAMAHEVTEPHILDQLVLGTPKIWCGSFDGRLGWSVVLYLKIFKDVFKSYSYVYTCRWIMEPQHN